MLSSDHIPIKFRFSKKVNANRTWEVLLYKNAKWNVYKKYLRELLDINPLINCENQLETCFSNFTKHLIKGIELRVPRIKLLTLPKQIDYPGILNKLITFKNKVKNLFHSNRNHYNLKIILKVCQILQISIIYNITNISMAAYVTKFKLQRQVFMENSSCIY